MDGRFGTLATEEGILMWTSLGLILIADALCAFMVLTGGWVSISSVMAWSRYRKGEISSDMSMSDGPRLDADALASHRPSRASEVFVQG